MTTGSPTSEVDAIVERLNSATNWMRQGAGDWKSVVNTYDRAPFEAATLLQSLEARIEEAIEWAFEKSRVHHRLAHENKELRTEHIASSTAYRELALELQVRAALTPSNRDRT